MVGTYNLHYMFSWWYHPVIAKFGTFWAWKWKLEILLNSSKIKTWFSFWGNDRFHRGLGGSIGVISLFYASYWIHITLCKSEKIKPLSNFDEKGVTEVTQNQGDPYCPECQNIPKYQPQGLQTCLGLFLTSFRHMLDQISWFGAELGFERPNFCFKAILGQFQVKFGVSSVTQNGV